MIRNSYFHFLPPVTLKLHSSSRFIQREREREREMKRRRTEEQEEEEEREESEDRSTSSNGAASSSPPAVNTTRQARFHRLVSHSRHVSNENRLPRTSTNCFRFTSRPQVYEKVREVKKGEIATYGRIAKAIGLDNYSRHVGFALAALPGSNSSTDV